MGIFVGQYFVERTKIHAVWFNKSYSLPWSFFCCVFLSSVCSPWYNNRTGWLGVKHQLTYLLLCVCVCICVSRYMFSCLHTLLLGIQMRERERNKLYFNGCVLINKSPPVMCLANKPKKRKKDMCCYAGRAWESVRQAMMVELFLLFPGWRWSGHAHYCVPGGTRYASRPGHPTPQWRGPGALHQWPWCLAAYTWTGNHHTKHVIMQLRFKKQNRNPEKCSLVLSFLSVTRCDAVVMGRCATGVNPPPLPPLPQMLFKVFCRLPGALLSEDHLTPHCCLTITHFTSHCC